MTATPSPVASLFAELAAREPGWRHEIGRPTSDGWIAGSELADATRGRFHDLLQRIGANLQTADRRTIAASFAMRYGWASGIAIVPFLRTRCVPDAVPTVLPKVLPKVLRDTPRDNVSFRFGASGFFDRVALHEPRGTVPAGDPRAAHPSVATVADDAALLRTLRDTLVAQSEPVVEALFAWAGFARRGTWGMLTSAWVSQFTTGCDTPDDQRPLLPMLDALFAGDDIASITRPRLHAVTHASATHLFQRRASCCRFYLLPQGSLCASCPLVSDEERLRRNVAWMATQAQRQGRTGGHG